jgi:hypothetical protein
MLESLSYLRIIPNYEMIKNTKLVDAEAEQVILDEYENLVESKFDA